MNNIDIKSLIQKHPEDVKQPFDRIIALIGIENVLKIVNEYGGTAIYVPNTLSLFKKSIDRQICQEFKGDNYFELATKYGVCTKTIRNITNNNRLANSLKR